jgi:hypothetical protein
MSEIQMEPEDVKKEPKEKEDLVKTFKEYFTKIISFKFGFKKYYFTRMMPGMKFYSDIHLEIILQSFRRLIEKYDLMAHLNRDDSNDSSTDSPMMAIEVKPVSPKEKDFISNLYKFQSIIEVLINIGPYEMFREVKSMILTEFETTALAIQKHLEKTNNVKDMQMFICLTQRILFIVSLIVFKLDYYTITINCLVEKLNRFFIDFVTRAKDSKQNNFVKCLNLVQKFFKIKKNYMTDFCMTATPINGKIESMFNFAFNKFCSFGRYFFSNLYMMMDNDIKLIPRISKQRAIFKTKKMKDLTPKSSSLFRHEFSKLPPRNSRSQTCVTKFLLKDDICKLEQSSDMEHRKKVKFNTVVRRRSKFGRLNPEMDKLFKTYFISKLVKWKYLSVNSTNQKSQDQICRICEKTYKIDNFILHLFYCKEQKLYIQNYNELRSELNKCLEKLNKYKE